MGQSSDLGTQARTGGIKTSARGKGERQPGRPRASWTIQVSRSLTVATLLTADQPVPRDHSLRATYTAEEFLPREGSCEEYSVRRPVLKPLLPPTPGFCFPRDAHPQASHQG